MRLLVTGSRTLTRSDGRLLLLGLAAVQEIAGPVSHLYHGGAVGADRMASAWAVEHGIPQTAILPDYAAHGPKAAPLIRNLALVEKCEWVLALYAPGRDRAGGTWYTVQAAYRTGKPVLEVMSDGRIDVTMPPLALF